MRATTRRMSLTQNSRSWIAALALLVLLPGFPASDVGGATGVKTLKAEDFHWPRGTTISYREVHTKGHSHDRWISIEIKNKELVAENNGKRYYFLGDPHTIERTVGRPDGFDPKTVDKSLSHYKKNAAKYYEVVATAIVSKIPVPKTKKQPLMWPTADWNTINNDVPFATCLTKLGVPLDYAVTHVAWSCGPLAADENGCKNHPSRPSTPISPSSSESSPEAIKGAELRWKQREQQQKKAAKLEKQANAEEFRNRLKAKAEENKNAQEQARQEQRQERARQERATAHAQPTPIEQLEQLFGGLTLGDHRRADQDDQRPGSGSSSSSEMTGSWSPASSDSGSEAGSDSGSDSAPTHGEAEEAAFFHSPPFPPVVTTF